LSYAAAAFAQWVWRDESGQLVFSDRSPPKSVKPNQIVRQPSAAATAATGPVYARDEAPDATKAENKTDAKKPAPATTAAPGPKTMAERDMEFRKRMQERSEADKKAAEEQAAKQQLAQACERSRGYVRALEDGRRIAQTDAQGNQVVLDDSARASELQRLRENLARDCS
jgi:type IV secretory pathway VirB10-like protein